MYMRIYRISTCGELTERARGMDMGDNVPCERWTYGEDRTIMIQIRLLDAEALQSDHIARRIKDNENENGQYGGGEDPYYPRI